MFRCSISYEKNRLQNRNTNKNEQDIHARIPTSEHRLTTLMAADKQWPPRVDLSQPRCTVEQSQIHNRGLSGDLLGSGTVRGSLSFSRFGAEVRLMVNEVQEAHGKAPRETQP